MKLALNHRPLEIAVDAAAAASFAAAAAFAGSSIGLHALILSAGAFAAAFLGLCRVAPNELHYPLPNFSVAEPDGGLDELPLTEDMMLRAPGRGEGELILDDVLAQLGPGSRVVRLFEPRQGQATGQLQDPPDAAQAMSDALAELRRSLR